VSGSVALQQQVQDAIDEMVASGAEDGLDSGVAIAVMRNRIVGDMSAAAAIDQMVADHLG
jgi:hypothetical protein